MFRTISRSALLAVLVAFANVFSFAQAVLAGTIWDAGGGANLDLTTALNWDSDTTPTLTGGTSLLTFGTAGTGTIVNTNIDVLGINVTLNGFSFFQTGAPVVTLRGSGFTSSSNSTVTVGPTVVFRGNLPIANNGSGLLQFGGLMFGNSSPTVTNNGTGTGEMQLAGQMMNSITKLVQNSATSRLRLSNGFNGFGSLEVHKGTVSIGGGGTAYGTGAMTLGNPAGGSDNATLLQQSSFSIGYTPGIVLASNTNGTLTIAQNSDPSGVFTVTFDGGVTGNNSFVIENRGGNDHIAFGTAAINNAGTITHIGTGGATGIATINSVIGPNVTGIIQNGGASALRLNGANTFAGTAIATSGNLQLGNVTALQNATLDVSGAGSITFNVAGTNAYNLGGLQGAGTLNAGANSLNVGGIAPGNSAGLLTVTTATLTLSDTSTFELDGTARGTQYDAVDVTGALVYDGDLVLDLGFDPSLFSTFDLFNFTGSQTGTFDSITFSESGYNGVFNYGTGVLTITQVPVPEPTSAALLHFGLIALAIRARCRQAANRRNG